MSRPNRLVLTDDDLFPAGTVSLNGYKVFGEERSRAISYAASVAKAAGSGLTPLLERQLTAEGGVHLPVDGLRFCEEGGVEATIRGETVLLGSAYFMKKAGSVALPREMKLPTGAFLAVDGALTAAFAIKYQPSRNAEWALRTLRRFLYHAGAGGTQRQRDAGADQAEVWCGRQAGVPGCVHAAGAGGAGAAAGRSALRGHLPGGGCCPWWRRWPEAAGR